MALIQLDLPHPKELRGGWAALAAVYASIGWYDDVYADQDDWVYHDGGGNWVCLRYIDKDKIIIFGYDKEGDTYFRDAAVYFEEEETDLLKDAPKWWATDLTPPQGYEWCGFIYGWNGEIWQRAEYELNDNFELLGLLKACGIGSNKIIMDIAMEVNQPLVRPVEDDVNALIISDGDITDKLLLPVAPKGNIDEGVTAGRKFLDMKI